MAFPRIVLPLPRDNQFSDQSAGSLQALQFAYERLLTYETDHSESSLPARWLGHLLREVPVKENLASEINSCRDNTAIERLSTFYRDRLVRLCEPHMLDDLCSS